MIDKKDEDINLVFSDSQGNVFDYPDIEPVFRTGKRFLRVTRSDLIKLPYGSYLFSLIDRYPVFFDRKESEFNHIKTDPDGAEIQAVSSFLSSGYLRTYLPAYESKKDAKLLSLWAYAGVVIIGDEFYVPAIKIDDDPRSDPEIHQNQEELEASISEVIRKFPDNRLVRQLKKCSTEYGCLCARNFFIGRFEAPVPTTPACNAECIGCLSYQGNDSDFSSSQNRLDFMPSPHEISEIIIHHFSNVKSAIASFGQGCEGEPLLRGKDLAQSISIIREKIDFGTININTNGSLPENVKLLIESGLDSIRISLNSPTEKYYTRYHKPKNYNFNDVKKSIEIALDAGIFVSINLFFMPGFTDMETEVESLFKFLEVFPVNMIQTRNLNIDPDLYFNIIGFEESEPIGISNLVNIINEKYPKIKLGYYNPSKEKF